VPVIAASQLSRKCEEGVDGTETRKTQKSPGRKIEL